MMSVLENMENIMEKVRDDGLFSRSYRLFSIRYHTMPHFDVLKIYRCGRHCDKKGEIVCNKHFLLFSQCFLPCMVLIFRFKCTLNVAI